MSQENLATPPEKGPVAPTLAALKGGVALQVASWKVSGYRGVLQVSLVRIHFSHPIGRRWGWGLNWDPEFKQIRGDLRKKAFFLGFLDFSSVVGALRKRAQGQKKGRKDDFDRFPGRAARHTFKPPFVTPPFAATQTYTSSKSNPVGPPKPQKLAEMKF